MILAFIQAVSLPNAGTVSGQPVEHDVEKQVKSLLAAKCCDLAHGIFGRSGNAQSRIRTVQIGYQKRIAAPGLEDGTEAEMVEAQFGSQRDVARHLGLPPTFWGWR